MEKRTIYSGTYMGIPYEICTFQGRDLNSSDPEAVCDKYTFYLYIHLNRIPKENNPESYWIKPERFSLREGRTERIRYGYEKHPVLSNMDWHSGITWYSKESNEDNPENKVIKIGCDYQHYWDEGKHYNIDIVLYEVKKCIESFREYVSGYKYWCSYNGELYDISEGKANPDGSSFISNKGIQSRIKSGWQLAEWMKEPITISEEEKERLEKQMEECRKNSKE